MPVRVRSLLLVPGSSSFAGWSGVWTNENVSGAGRNNINSLAQSSIRNYAGIYTPADSVNIFQFADKATPTVWTVQAIPNASLAVNTIWSASDDVAYIGLARPADARMYKFSHTSGFTNMNFPEQGTSDAVQTIVGTNDSDILLVANQARSTAGSSALWKLQISTVTWTKIGGLGIFNSWTANQKNSAVKSILIINGILYVFVSGNTVNLAQVWKTTDTNWNDWVKIAGDGLNGSWATGTKQNGKLLYFGGILYAAIGGTANGDAEVWATPISAFAWSQVGGDSLNGSWAAGTKNSCQGGAGAYVSKLAFSTQGTVAGDSQVWEYDPSAPLANRWFQLGAGAWSRKSTASLLVLTDGTLYAGVGNDSTGTAVLFGTDPGAVATGGGAQFSVVYIRS